MVVRDGPPDGSRDWRGTRIESSALSSLAFGRTTRVRRIGGRGKQHAGIWGISPISASPAGNSDQASCRQPGSVMPPDSMSDGTLGQAHQRRLSYRANSVAATPGIHQH
jgi:hypothetical protein